MKPVRNFLRKFQKGAIFDSEKTIKTWRANLVIFCVHRYHSYRCENYKPNQLQNTKGKTDFKAFANPQGDIEVEMRDFVFDRMKQLGVRPDELQFCIEKGNAFYFRVTQLSTKESLM